MSESPLRPFSWFSVLVFTAGITFSGISLAADDLTTAVDAWLADKDEVAIPALAEHAAAGNVDAQLFLEQIRSRPGVPSPFLAGLGAKERNALLKAPGGAFGKSWLQVNEAENGTARALQHASDPKFQAQGIETLLDLGEAGPAVPLLLELFNFGDFPEVMRLSEHENFPKDARTLAWLSALLAPADAGAGRRENLLAELDEELADYDIGALAVLFGSRTLFEPEKAAALGPQFAVADILNAYAYKRGSLADAPTSPEADRVDLLLLEEGMMKPLVGICTKDCPESKTSCLRTLYHGVGGYRGYLSLQSPLERLVPRDAYFTSKRHTAEIKRFAFKLFDARWGAGADAPSGSPVVAEADQCIVSNVLGLVDTAN